MKKHPDFLSLHIIYKLIPIFHMEKRHHLFEYGSIIIGGVVRND